MRRANAYPRRSTGVYFTQVYNIGAYIRTCLRYAPPQLIPFPTFYITRSIISIAGNAHRQQSTVASRSPAIYPPVPHRRRCYSDNVSLKAIIREPVTPYLPSRLPPRTVRSFARMRYPLASLEQWLDTSGPLSRPDTFPSFFPRCIRILSMRDITLVHTYRNKSRFIVGVYVTHYSCERRADKTLAK